MTMGMLTHTLVGIEKDAGEPPGHRKMAKTLAIRPDGH